MRPATRRASRSCAVAATPNWRPEEVEDVRSVDHTWTWRVERAERTASSSCTARRARPWLESRTRTCAEGAARSLVAYARDRPRPDRQPLQAPRLRVPVGRDLRRLPLHLRLRPARRRCMLRNVKDAWSRSMVQQRDDVVLHRRRDPRPAAGLGGQSGHLANFTDPLVDCTQLQAALPPRQARRPRHVPELRRARTRFTEARQFNLMFKTHAGPVEDAGAVAYLRPETAQGMFVNFANVLQTTPQEAAVRHRPGRQVVPQRDHAAELDLPHPRVRADGDGVLRAARRRRRSGTSTGATSACDWYVDLGIPADHAAAAPARRRRAVALLGRARPTSSSCSRGASTSSRASPNAPTTTSTQHAEHSGERLDYFDQATERALRAPTSSSRRPAPTRTMAAFLLAAYDEDEVNGETRTVLRLHPRLAPYKVAVLPLSKKDTLTPLGPARCATLLRRALHGRLRRDPGDRPPLPPPGRDRHAARASPSTSTRSTTRPSRSATATRTEQVRVPIDERRRRARRPPRLLSPNESPR